MPHSSILRRPAVMLVLALASVSVVVTLMGRLASGPPVEQKRVPMGGAAGSDAYPAFSPDGKRVAYSARDASKISAFHIFVREAPNGAPKQLTQGENSDVAPVWSPDGGALAFERIGEAEVDYIVIPADGGPERQVARTGAPLETGNPLPGVAWTPDGKSLVIVQIADKQAPALAVVSAEGGQQRRITNPPEGSEGDSTPAASPSGDAVAFVRATAGGGGDIWICDLNGAAPRRVTFDDKAVRGLAWSRDGEELIYSANRAGGWRLWRIPAAGGSPREIAIAGRQAYYPAIGRNRLAYTDSPVVSAIWRATIGPEGAAAERPVIRSAGRESSPAWSPDGTRIADISGQTDNDEIYIQNAGGSGRFQLTRLDGPRIGRPRWSPDGKQILFDASGDDGRSVFIIGAVAGAQPARVLLNASGASFSHNGKWIYFESRGQIWKATPAGANPQPISGMQGASQPVESADGKYILFRARRTFWRTPVEGGKEEEFRIPDQELMWASTIQPVKQGFYFLQFLRGQREFAISFYDVASGKTSTVMSSHNFDMGGNNAGAFSVSPDGRYILFPKVDRSQTNIMLIENFK